MTMIAQMLHNTRIFKDDGRSEFERESAWARKLQLVTSESSTGERGHAEFVDVIVAAPIPLGNRRYAF